MPSHLDHDKQNNHLPLLDFKERSHRRERALVVTIEYRKGH